MCVKLLSKYILSFFLSVPMYVNAQEMNKIGLLNNIYLYTGFGINYIHGDVVGLSGLFSDGHMKRGTQDEIDISLQIGVSKSITRYLSGHLYLNSGQISGSIDQFNLNENKVCIQGRALVYGLGGRLYLNRLKQKYTSNDVLVFIETGFGLSASKGNYITNEERLGFKSKSQPHILQGLGIEMKFSSQVDLELGFTKYTHYQDRFDGLISPVRGSKDKLYIFQCGVNINLIPTKQSLKWDRIKTHKRIIKTNQPPMKNRTRKKKRRKWTKMPEEELDNVLGNAGIDYDFKPKQFKMDTLSLIALNKNGEFVKKRKQGVETRYSDTSLYNPVKVQQSNVLPINSIEEIDTSNIVVVNNTPYYVDTNEIEKFVQNDVIIDTDRVADTFDVTFTELMLLENKVELSTDSLLVEELDELNAEKLIINTSSVLKDSVLMDNLIKEDTIDKSPFGQEVLDEEQDFLSDSLYSRTKVFEEDDIQVLDSLLPTAENMFGFERDYLKLENQTLETHLKHVEVGDEPTFTREQPVFSGDSISISSQNLNILEDTFTKEDTNKRDIGIERIQESKEPLDIVNTPSLFSIKDSLQGSAKERIENRINNTSYHILGDFSFQEKDIRSDEVKVLVKTVAEHLRETSQSYCLIISEVKGDRYSEIKTTNLLMQMLTLQFAIPSYRIYKDVSELTNKNLNVFVIRVTK